MSRPRSTTEGRLTQIVLIVLALAFLGVFLLLPLIVVFSEALKQGWGRSTPSIRPMPWRRSS
jgi:sulfate transport system permease protein